MQAGIDFTARCMAAEALANGGGGGTPDYTQLANKPSINDVELDGNKTSANLGLQSAIDSTHKLDADLVDDTSSTNKFATATELAQIETNKTNILSVLDADGTKNRLLITSPSQTTNGVSFIVNSDGTVTATRVNTSSSNAYFNLTDYLPIDDYVGMVLSGNPSGASGSTYRISAPVYDTNKQYLYEIVDYSANGALITKGSQAAYIRITCTVFASQSVSGLVFEPMLCSKALWDISHRYEPYAMSNVDLTTAVSSFGYKTKEITLSSLNFTQATGGLFYSTLLDCSSEFDEIYSVNLNGFNNLAGNWAIMFSVKPGTLSYGIVIQDPTNPATLTVGSAVIKTLIFGKLKQS